MSNNIYDILKKMQNLEAPKQALTESKTMSTVKELHNESKKEKLTVKGSIAEAVRSVESQLNEKYMGFKKTVAAIKKGGSAENPEAVAAAIGRKKYGKEKFQKAAAAGKKLGEQGVDETGTVPPKHYGGTGPTGAAFDLYMAQRKEALAAQKPKNEGRYIASTGQSHKDLESFMSGDDRHEKQPRTYDQLQPDRELDPKDTTTWRGPKKHIQHRQKTGGIRGPRGRLPEGEYNEDMLSPAQKKFAALAEPKNKITYADKIAGAKKDKKDEGNEFSGELAQARAQGKDSFEVDGKTYTVKEGRSRMREGWEEMQKYLEKKRGPESKGGEGKKAGTRYGGSAQKDDDEATDGEGQAVVKKKGRPKGTGGGAKFSFKKPKD